MVRGLLVLLICQLAGEFLVTASGVPLPGPVVGLVILLVALTLRRPTSKSSVVRASDGLLSHLQLLFIPAGAGVIGYLPLLGRSWLPIVGGLVLGWLAALLCTAGAGVAGLWLDDRLRRRQAVRDCPVSLHLAAAWTGLVHSPLLGLVLTLGAYQAARLLWTRTGRHSLANPVLVGIAVVVGVLLLTGVDYADYLRGAQYVGFLLGPATVALALPLYRQSRHIRRSAVPILLSLVTGAVSAIVVAIVVTKLLGGNDQLALTMAPKSATTPIAIALAQSSGGLPALAAVLTVLTGVLGAVAAPRVLTVLGITDERVRGFAIGMSSHGIGTSRAFQESPLTGAFSGLAMALNALATAVALPVLLAVAPWLLRVAG